MGGTARIKKYRLLFIAILSHSDQGYFTLFPLYTFHLHWHHFNILSKVVEKTHFWRVCSGDNEVQGQLLFLVPPTHPTPFPSHILSGFKKCFMREWERGEKEREMDGREENREGKEELCLGMGHRKDFTEVKLFELSLDKHERIR